jgi:hypothetical protein
LHEINIETAVIVIIEERAARTHLVRHKKVRASKVDEVETGSLSDIVEPCSRIRRNDRVRFRLLFASGNHEHKETTGKQRPKRYDAIADQ